MHFNHRLTFIFFLIYTFIGTAVSAAPNDSNPYIDSLKQQIDSQTDSAKVDLLNLIAYNYYYFRSDSTTKYAEQARQLALDLEYKKGLAEAQRLTGLYLKAKNKEKEAIDWLFRGLETAQSVNDYQGIADNFNSIGIFFSSLEDHKQAVSYFKKSLAFQIKAKNKLREALVYSNLGEEMLDHHDLDSAYFYYHKSEYIIDSVGIGRWLAMIKSRIAEYHFERNNLVQSQAYAEEAILLSQKTNQPIHLRKACLVLSKIYIRKAQFDDALTMAERTLQLSLEIGFADYLAEAYLLQYRVHKAKENFQTALRFHELYSVYMDSIRRDQIISESNMVRNEMELRQKEKENMLLRKEKEINDAQKIADKALIKRQTLIGTVILSLLLMVTVLALVFFRLRQKEHDTNRKLIDSNIALENQKEELSATLQMVEHLNAQLQAQNNTLNKTAIVSITDLEGNIISVNKNFCEVSGYTRDELQGINTRILNSGEHQSELFEDMWKTISNGKTWRKELKNKRKDGAFYWADTAITPILNDEGQPKQYFSLQFDITDRKKTLDQLKAKSLELEELNKLKDKLLSIISHDFRGPLNSLRGTLTLFVKGALSNEELGFLTESLIEKLDITYNLLENLLNWAKSQMKGMKVYAKEIDLKLIADDCMSLLSPAAEKKLIKIENKINKSVTAFADNEMIKLVLRNLISNAVKFTTAGNKIILDAQDENGFVTVSVQDHGLGISNEHQAKLFKLEIFSTTGTSNESGIGLGLALCKDFVEKNGGKIRFESEFGKGSTFYFTLPTSEEQISE